MDFDLKCNRDSDLPPSSPVALDLASLEKSSSPLGDKIVLRSGRTSFFLSFLPLLFLLPLLLFLLLFLLLLILPRSNKRIIRGTRQEIQTVAKTL